MREFTKGKKILLAIYVLAFILAAFIISTPAPSSDLSGYSAIEVIKHIGVISEKEHSVFEQDNLAEVREYLIEQVTEYSEPSAVEVITKKDHYDELHDVTYDLNNILVTIPGKNHDTNPTGVLVMAHYDSRGHIGRFGELGNSYGAADDGYGLGVLLETVRLFYPIKDELETSIYVLFTDAEETGLYGAEMAAENQEFADKINFVINIEARGSGGPVYMFETNKNNAKTLDLYQNARNKYGFSVATAVYQVMPNSSDFTEFMAIDKAGINFACLDSLEQYHTPDDNINNVDVSTIQHYGEQIMPVLEEYTSDAKYLDMNYFESSNDSVFFMVLPSVMITYNENISIVLGFVLLALLIFAVYMHSKQNKLSIAKITINLGYLFGTMISLSAVGYVLSRIAAIYEGAVWNLTNTRAFLDPTAYYISLVVISYILYRVVAKFFKTKTSLLELLFAGNILLTLFTIITNFTLSGASFLFFVPALLSTISLILYLYIKNNNVRKGFMVLAQIVTILIYVPLFYGLYIAITIGGLLALYAILLFFLATTLPSFVLITRKEIA